jgi:hypothetical protein
MVTNPPNLNLDHQSVVATGDTNLSPIDTPQPKSELLSPSSSMLAQQSFRLVNEAHLAMGP